MRQEKYFDGVVRRWFKAMTPQGFLAAMKLNELESMKMEIGSDGTVLPSGRCAICLDNGYILQQNNSHRKCLCVGG